jgi:TPR repeat protein
MYQNGQGVERNVETALSIQDKACSQGAVMACFALGTSYSTGQNGVPKDAVKAGAYLEKACDGGYSAACNNGKPIK